MEEESYFFKLSHYQKQLLEYYKSHPEFLQPPQRANEVIRFVEEGLRDLAVSRSKIRWGIPVPSDKGHVIYVWFDAVIGYLSASIEWAKNQGTPDLYKKWWYEKTAEHYYFMGKANRIL